MKVEPSQNLIGCKIEKEVD